MKSTPLKTFNKLKTTKLATDKFKFGSDYLKSITQPVERGKCYYKNMEITGLYMNNEEYPLKEYKFFLIFKIFF